MKARLYVKDTKTGLYRYRCIIPVPVTTEELLDEELDKCFIITNNDKTEIYPPNTEVKIVIEQGEEKKEFYYIVGDDDSTEISVN